MSYTATQVKWLIRKQLLRELDGQEAAQLLAARMFFDEDELIGMEMQVLRELADENPALSKGGEGLDAATIIGKVRRQRIRRLFAVGLRAASIVVAVLVVGVLSYHFHSKRAARERLVTEPWVGVAEQIPTSEFACTVYWGDSTAITVHRTSKGRLGRLGSVEVWKNDDGELELVPLPTTAWVAGWGLTDIRVTTGGQQQCVVRLPDGVRIRLDAGSTLSYPLANLSQADTRAVLQGQALVDVRERMERPQTFALETANGRVSTRAAAFMVLANPTDTRVVSLGGVVQGDFPVEDGQRRLSNAGEMVNFDRCCYNEDGSVSMVLSDIGLADMRKALAWMAKERMYKDVPLRDFVTAELNRWNDMEMGSLACIPEDYTVTAKVSYQTPVDEIYAYIREAGVEYHEGRGRISFCGPELDPHLPQSPADPMYPAEQMDLPERWYRDGLLAYGTPLGSYR